MASVVLSSGGSGGGNGRAGGPKYKITVPQSLVGGEYKLDQDISQQAGSQIPTDGVNSHDVHPAGGQYTGGMKSLVMLGLYGTVDDPDEGVDRMVDGLTSSPSVEVAVPEKEFTPTGGGDPLTCGVEVKNQAGQKIPLAFCVWGTSSTTVSVVETDAADLRKDPKSIDLQDFADKASKIRAEVQVPLGG
ncbi:hypothetical protein FCH28_22540 [Streptomyces piniterrae]|uniref:Uncharacterized protein n=1 Tax=Streptomyces piniterrae TaxID=2571125 RepID=A0A4U0N903_9ACTN|nr:hypothetical protein [Streptomyces piniterrae]TJZ50103.1 hypothetical protein FCH28_22540 [Streptomyces piniterrae]